MNNFERIEFHNTPFNSVRVYLYFDEDKDISSKTVRSSKEFNLFQALSIWGGYDKVEFGFYSWELSKSLVPYFKEMFGHRNDSVLKI
ncbi:MULTISPECIES: hypothetical protein [Paenibacillus]|jgi:hypothetical protein|uniref:Uncharacterized protein n=2 Tax=Paenibacillus TaxID=44249 RepID=A0ABX2ZAD4_PAEPO|nr:MULTISPECIES: hypothetical protein [Paenibacillus]MDR6779387.1 hypothetical protein [Paenibacillus peoriae]ODA08290.1 hypothetical protein A7312_27525 [Paenibacillus polymyxa]